MLDVRGGFVGHAVYAHVLIMEHALGIKMFPPYLDGYADL